MSCLHRLHPRPPPSSSLPNLLTTNLRPDPTTQVVGGVGSGLRQAVQSPLQSPGGGGGRGQALQVLARFCLPLRVPSRVPRRVPSLTSTLRGARGGSLEGTLGGRRHHVVVGTAYDNRCHCLLQEPTLVEAQEL